MTASQPRATYRLQLHAGFGFADAVAVVPYLAELGISHLYLSPVLQAAKGSTHGYDVIDPDRVSDALGGETGWRELVTAAHRAGLGILLDIVPNHMSIADTDNLWWRDVLENGAASFHSNAFDVDWATATDDRVVLPVLGERYGRALSSGSITIERSGARFELHVGDMRFPVSPRSLGRVVRDVANRLATSSGATDGAERRRLTAVAIELQFLGDALAELPPSREHDFAARARRHRDRAVLLRRLDELCMAEPLAGEALAAELAAINADAPSLDALLESQNYRLAHWSVAGSQLSYRRFFDITSLVGLRVEDPEVLAASHHRIFGWLADGSIDGVRIDHIDGLRAPAGYLTTLRSHAPDAWIVVEKILAAGEHVPAAWPIDGTTGVDALEWISRLIVDADVGPRLAAAFTEYTGEPFEPALTRRRARLEVMTDALHSELERLTELAARVCATSPMGRDYARSEVRTALAELLAGYPAYRTYLGEGDAPSVGSAQAAITEARAAIDVTSTSIDSDLLDLLVSALAFELPTAEAHELACTAQQMSGPIVAKGDEDTLAYRQVALASRCEVGADLATFGAELSDVHAFFAAAPSRSLVASSTHDAKRSEDVRARIAALSEMPAAWLHEVMSWRRRAEPGWGDVAPDRVLEYLVWQTLVGAWPVSEDRARTFAEKASREARRRTSWRTPDTAYEAARDRWVAGIFADPQLVADLAGFAARLVPHGDRNSLAMLLVKLTVPGVPDFFQGCELRSDSLVDPDNRRSVDFASCQRELRAIGDLTARDVAGELGRAKLWLTRRVLGLRRSAPELFAATYHTLPVTGRYADNVFAFARGDGLVTVVPRAAAAVTDWRDTCVELPAGNWRDVLDDRRIPSGRLVAASTLWGALSVALLVGYAPMAKR